MIFRELITIRLRIRPTAQTCAVGWLPQRTVEPEVESESKPVASPFPEYHVRL
jgi:hypothetical protein